ncbi:MAG: response regulator transcription factor [Rhodospirillales bacterium]|nr:response regulator transcription factor [Rhodospirillales bacterium]
MDAAAAGAASMDAAAGPAPEPGLRPPLNVLIASHVRFFREGLADVLGRDPMLSIAGLAADLHEVAARCRQATLHILLLDAALPDGLGAVRHVRACAPAVRIVALALDETEENVMAWAEAGADGYVPGNTALADLAAAIASAARGEQTCSAAVAGGLLRRITELALVARRQIQVPAPVLTARESQVISLICAGLSNKDIARSLGIELATVKSHVHNLLGKLKVQRRRQVAACMREQETSLLGPSLGVSVLACGDGSPSFLGRRTMGTEI